GTTQFQVVGQFGFPQGGAKMPIPKPQAVRLPARWSQQPKIKRFPVRNLMTIALGMTCQGGLVIAADTRMSTPEGVIYDACKLKTFLTIGGVFVIAYSSEIASAGETLVNEVMSDLTANDPNSFTGVEQWLKAAMTRWSSEYKDEPRSQLILGVFIGGKIGLYFCQPPNTVNRKTLSDPSKGYIAVGAGAAVTDPLFRTLFGSVCDLLPKNSAKENWSSPVI